MRQIIYRTLAGLIVIAAGYTAFITVAKRDFTTGFEFGIVAPILGFLLIVPSFTAYALFGEKSGNRVLVPLVKLLNLPDTLANRLARRYVQIPPGLEPPGETGENQRLENITLPSKEPTSESTAGHSNNG